MQILNGIHSYLAMHRLLLVCHPIVTTQRLDEAVRLQDNANVENHPQQRPSVYLERLRVFPIAVAIRVIIIGEIEDKIQFN